VVTVAWGRENGVARGKGVIEEVRGKGVIEEVRGKDVKNDAVKEEKHAKNDVVRVTGVRSVHDVEKGKDARSVHDVEKGKDARSVHDAVRVKHVLGSANERPQVRRVQRTHATSVVA
jgi:hypothetical protein